MLLVLPDVAYRNGTYATFHAGGTTDPTASDIKYFNMLKAWKVRGETGEFHFTDSHAKNEAVKDSSKRETLRARLIARLRNSKNMILIITDTTRDDDDWVPFEIRYAIDECAIPIIAAYPGIQVIMNPQNLSHLWPGALATRIQNNSASVIHVPFYKYVVSDAVDQFGPGALPKGNGLGHYSRDAHKNFGLL